MPSRTASVSIRPPPVLLALATLWALTGLGAASAQSGMTTFTPASTTTAPGPSSPAPRPRWSASRPARRPLRTT